MTTHGKSRWARVCEEAGDAASIVLMALMYVTAWAVAVRLCLMVVRLPVSE